MQNADTVKSWPVPFEANELVMAPDGTVFFSVPGVAVGRLNPATNEVTTWRTPAFHLSMGPRFSVQSGGHTFTEDFTVALIRLNGQVRLLLPNSGLYVQWQLPTRSQDITTSGTLLWVTLFAGTDSTEVASLDVGTNLLTRYDLPQSLAGPDGFVHGLSFGNGRLWYGIITGEAGGTEPNRQMTGSLDPATGTAKVWPMFSTPAGAKLAEGRAATFAAGSSWTFYHSTDPALTGLYRLKPGANTLAFYGAPLGTPGPLPPTPIVERIDRAAKARGSAWAATSSQEQGTESAQVIRWNPLDTGNEEAVSPVEPTVTISATTLVGTVFSVAQSTTTITPEETSIIGTVVSPSVTIWNFADRRLATRFTLGPHGAVYFGLMVPSTGQAFLEQLSTKGSEDSQDS
jgi:streptogramin lyase